MKKSKLTIAVLSACMLAATGGISLGAAALANAPEAIEAPEGSLVAGQVISDGIKVIKKASFSNDAISFTYAVTPDYAVTNVTATLSWNVSGVSEQIEEYLEITSHNTATKTVVVHKKADFSHQAKLILTDSMSNSSATVLIDCMSVVEDSRSGKFDIECDSIWEDFGLCNNHSQLNWVNLDGVINEGLNIWENSIDPEVHISDVSIHGGLVFSRTTSTWNYDTKVQNDEDGTSLSDQSNVVSKYAIAGQDLEDFQVSYGAIEISDAWLQSMAQEEYYRYIHFEITFKVCVSWNTADSTHTSINGQGGSMNLYPTYRWCYDKAEIARASAITAEAGHIYF